MSAIDEAWEHAHTYAAVVALGDVVSVMSSKGMDLDPIEELRFVPGEEVESAFYLHLEVADQPGVLAQIAKILGDNRVSVKSVVQKGMGDNARLVMVVHPVAEGRFTAAVTNSSRDEFVARRDARARRRARSRTRCGHGSGAQCSLPWPPLRCHAGRCDGTR